MGLIKKTFKLAALAVILGTVVSACQPDPIEELRNAGCDPELPGFPCCLPQPPPGLCPEGKL